LIKYFSDFRYVDQLQRLRSKSKLVKNRAEFLMFFSPKFWGYRGGSPTAVQAWPPCLLWEPSPSHPILV